MSTERPLIKLYRTRKFGEKISDTFDFVRENWRTLFKYVTYLLLPLALVQTFAMGSYMTNYMSIATQGTPDAAGILASVLPMGVVGVLAALILSALTYTLMDLYERRPGRLQGVTFSELRPGILKRMGRQIALIVTSLVVFGVLFLISGLLITALGYGAVLLLIVLWIAVLPLFALVQPAYLFEPIGIVSAYAKSVRLGWKTWAGIVAVVIVLYIIISIVQGVVSMPWYIMVFLENILGTQNGDAGFVSSFGYDVLQYLLGVVSSFAGYCLMTLLCIGTAYQYGHACDKVDGVSVDHAIENFEELIDGH